VNKKRVFTLGEAFLDEEERQKQLGKIFAKVKELEDDKLNCMNSTASSSFSKTTSTTSVSSGGFNS
jgi:hypothetical protein